jgi:Tfp pilus assembly protein PilN
MSSWPGIDFLPRSALWGRVLGVCTSARARAAYLLLTAMTVSWVAWLGLTWQRTERESVALQEHLTRLEPAGPPALPARRQALNQNQLRLAADVIARLNTDWPTLLNELERLTPPEVAVLEIEPRPSQATLTLTIETRTAQDAWRYADTLNGSPHLRDVRALKHETNDRDKTRPLRFTLSAVIGSRP